MFDVDQQRRELLAPPGVATDRERAERVAVVALPPGDETGAFGLADLDEVLARELQRRLDSLRTAGDEIGLLDACGRVLDQMICERLGDLGREEAGVRVRKAVDLRVHRGEHVGMRMAEAGHGRAAAGVDVLAALAVGDADAFGCDGDRRQGLELAMEYVRHGGGMVSR